MKRWIFAWVAFFLATTACTPAQSPDEGYDESLYRDTDRRYGYVRTQPGPRGFDAVDYRTVGFSRQRGNEFYNATDGGELPGPDAYIDRNVLARQIAYLTTRLPQVDDATVLVTDDHVFIGVRNADGKVKDKTLYEARRTALSLTPRYFKIHVTGETALRDRLNRIGTHLMGTRDKNVQMNREDLERLIRDMGDTTPPDMDRPTMPMRNKRIGPAAGDMAR